MVEVPVADKGPKSLVPTPVALADPFGSLRNEMDRLFDRFAAGLRLPPWRGPFDFEPAWRHESSFSFAAPAMDVTEDEKAYKITAEMPGLDEKSIEVSVADDMLTLTGEKREEKEEKNKNRYISERAYGSFQRRFALPDSVDRDKIAAELTKGVLTITLPKKAEARKPTKKIAVKAAA